MNILIQTIPHAKQRYPTCGDWETIGDSIKISVSETGNWKYDMAVAVHELVEVLLCKDQGITQDVVDAFDIAFEKARGLSTKEPGDTPSAPYHLQHGFATAVERMLIAAFKENWDTYDETLSTLSTLSKLG